MEGCFMCENCENVLDYKVESENESEAIVCSGCGYMVIGVVHRHLYTPTVVCPSCFRKLQTNFIKNEQ